MEFEHNSERDAYIAARGKVVLNACPGSGKTTTIAFKLHELIGGWKKANGKYVGIACLSFTNVAKDEINSKYSGFHGASIRYPHIVSTIDSFINRNITLPFYYLFQNNFEARPTIVDNPQFMNKWSFGFYQTVPRKGGGTFRRPIHLAYPPSSIDINLDGTFSSDGHKPSLSGNDLINFNLYCQTLKKIQFTEGLLKNSDSTFVALDILRKYPIVAKILARRFPYIIIDEAQDTSEIQYAIIDELIKNNLSNIEFVGDPYQSLYEWREARPDLFMLRHDSKEWHSLNLNKCRRSTQVIVDCFSNFRCECDLGLESENNIPDPERIRVLRYSETKSLLEKYNKISSSHAVKRVLVRGGTLLEAFGVIVKHEIMWKIDPCVPYHLILSKYEMNKGDINSCVRRIRRCLPFLINSSLDVRGQKAWLEKEGNKPFWNARIIELVARLPPFDLSLAEWTSHTQKLCMQVLETEHLPNFELKKGNKSPLHKEKVSILYKSSTDYSIVSTIHAVKGMTFDSNMLVLSKNSLGQNISINDFSRPEVFPGEKKRMIYVAMSRPRQQLVIAIPQDAKITDAELKERLGDEIEIETITQIQAHES
jgi:DNA helicase-2/ATP-dependent DNA helicase PcrA